MPLEAQEVRKETTKTIKVNSIAFFILVCDNSPYLLTFAYTFSISVLDNLFSMDGPKVYKMARKKVYELINDDLYKNNLNIDDINLVIPHQASGMAVKAYSKFGGFKR